LKGNPACLAVRIKDPEHATLRSAERPPGPESLSLKDRGGEILFEAFLEPLEISPAQLARDLNVPSNRINQIVRGKRVITADTALRLGQYLGIEPEYWLNLQLRYNMKGAQDKAGLQIKKEVKPYQGSKGSSFHPSAAILCRA
jgi:antitoxin HigA-1